eukprot:g17003.t1
MAYAAEVFSAKIAPEDLGTTAKPAPTKISVKILIDECKIVNQQHGEALQFKVQFCFHWVDERFVDFPPDLPMPPDVWRPEIMLSGGLSIKKEVKETTLPTFHDKNRQDGVLQLEFDTEPAMVDLLRDDPEALKTFPFDSFRFDFACCLAGEKRLENQQDVRVRFDKQVMVDTMEGPADTSLNRSKGDDFVFRPTPRSGEFVTEAITYGIGMHTSPRTGLSYDDVVFSVHLQRNAAYYIFKGVLPLYGILFLSNLCFFIDNALLSDRLALVFGMFLTAFAIQWTILDRLPRVPYLTFLDQLIAAAIFGLCVIALGSCVAHKVKYPSGTAGGGGGDLLFDGAVSRADFADWADLVSLFVADASFLLLHAVAHTQTVLRRAGGGKGGIGIGMGKSSNSGSGGYWGGLAGVLELVVACLGQVGILMARGLAFCWRCLNGGGGGKGKSSGEGGAESARGKSRKFKQGGQGFHRIMQFQEGQMWRFEDLSRAVYDEKGTKKSTMGKGTPVEAADF